MRFHIGQPCPIGNSCPQCCGFALAQLGDCHNQLAVFAMGSVLGGGWVSAQILPYPLSKFKYMKSFHSFQTLSVSFMEKASMPAL